MVPTHSFSSADVKTISSDLSTSRWAMGLVLISVFVLFYHLGTSALFEPDEGRNAEKAREILLLNDWVTPHQDFLPILDKPMSFYWLVAIAYKLFGISEWSARLPSAVAAFGCILLIYSFVKKYIGSWQALWSGLILVTTVEFFILARTVIFDMTLTFFVTLALCCFYSGLHAGHETRRKILFLTMYAAMGAATLLKGLIGIILPGMIIGPFLLLTKNWSVLRKMNLFLGAAIVLAIILPWYISVELRNPGYLHYFFWEEHFVRFATPHFGRSEPWYYFLMVLVLGGLPWTFLFPQVVIDQWKKPRDEMSLFLMLWAVLPLLFFSLSHSKLPHYILPIFPPVAILTAVTFAKMLGNPSDKTHRVIFFPFYAQALVILSVVAGAIRPSLLPADIGEHFARMSWLLYIVGAAVLTAIFVLALARLKGYSRNPKYLYVFYGISLLPLFILTVHVMKEVSLSRSAKPVAEKAAPFIGPNDQLVLYDKDLEGLPFYLRIKQPIWVVWSGNRSAVLGSFYIAEKKPQPAKSYGKVLFTFDEFADQWENSGQPKVVFLREKSLPNLVRQDGTLPEVLVRVNRFVLVKSQGAKRLQ